jgi:hypothetical protein
MRAICQVGVPKARTQRTAQLALIQGLKQHVAEMHPAALELFRRQKRSLPLQSPKIDTISGVQKAK